MATGLIVGMGEVGKALCEILSTVHSMHVYDSSWQFPLREDLKVDVLHICFPYSDQFKACVQSYQEHVQPSYTVIHSTVPVGTSKALECYHSPVRGVHPHLAESMKTFVTYLAADNPQTFNAKNNHLSRPIIQYFLDAGMNLKAVSQSEDTEAGKLWSLAAYAMNILLEKEIYKYCQENELDFRMVYQHFTDTYNDGYARMGVNNVQRPVLDHMEGTIGGHCIIPGVEKLADSGSLLAEMILGLNSDYA